MRCEQAVGWTALGLQLPTTTESCNIYAQRPNYIACGPSHETVSPVASAARVLPGRLPHHARLAAKIAACAGNCSEQHRPAGRQACQSVLLGYVTGFSSSTLSTACNSASSAVPAPGVHWNDIHSKAAQLAHVNQCSKVHWETYQLLQALRYGREAQG